MTAGEDIPRLFYLAPGHPEPTPGAEPVAEGVQWPDGSITVWWAGDVFDATSNWQTLDTFDAELSPSTSVVWRRQDTYATPAEGGPA